jgi:RNA polymerase sigma factor (sigma-70 family)
VNLARDRWRKMARSRARTESDVAGGADRARIDASERSGGPINEFVERDAMLQALQALPEGQRDVIVLRFYLDLTVAETAEILGIAEGTVKSTVSRAVHRLRDLFETEPTAVPSEVPHAE